MFLLKCNKLTLGYNNKDILHSFDYGIHSGEYLFFTVLITGFIPANTSAS